MGVKGKSCAINSIFDSTGISEQEINYLLSRGDIIEVKEAAKPKAKARK